MNIMIQIQMNIFAYWTFRLKLPLLLCTEFGTIYHTSFSSHLTDKWKVYTEYE